MNIFWSRHSIATSTIPLRAMALIHYSRFGFGTKVIPTADWISAGQSMPTEKERENDFGGSGHCTVSTPAATANMSIGFGRGRWVLQKKARAKKQITPYRSITNKRAKTKMSFGRYSADDQPKRTVRAGRLHPHSLGAKKTSKVTRTDMHSV